MKYFLFFIFTFYFNFSFGQKDSVAPVKAGTIFYGDAGIIEDTCRTLKHVGDSARRDTLPISVVIPKRKNKIGKHETSP